MTTLTLKCVECHSEHTFVVPKETADWLHKHTDDGHFVEVLQYG